MNQPCLTLSNSLPPSKLNQATILKSTAVDADTKTALATAANEARGLAMDSIAAAHSGHMGLPLGAAEIGAVLYGSQVSSTVFNTMPQLRFDTLYALQIGQLL